MAEGIRCPKCEHRYFYVKDFPRLHVLNFSRCELPKETLSLNNDFLVVGFWDNLRFRQTRLPKELRAIAKRTGYGRFEHSGAVYVPVPFIAIKAYCLAEDITSEARKIVESRQIQDYLSYLESLKGKTIEPENLYFDEGKLELIKKDLEFFCKPRVEARIDEGILHMPCRMTQEQVGKGIVDVTLNIHSRNNHYSDADSVGLARLSVEGRLID